MDSSKNKPLKYCFGPVPSRRLGLSLGVDILPHKFCNLDCIYCELGPTLQKTCKKDRYRPIEPIQEELAELLARDVHFDTLTITASGEPTLHSDLGLLVSFAKDVLKIGRLALLTNATLLNDPDVQHAVSRVDILLPSLDAARETSFRRINRPCQELSASQIIHGLQDLQGKYRGSMWLEVLLVKGINDAPEDIDALRQAITSIQPAKVQLNTVNRPPAVEWAKPLSLQELQAIQGFLGGNTEIIADFRIKERGPVVWTEDDISAMLTRRPMDMQALLSVTQLDSKKLKEILQHMEDTGRLQRRFLEGKTFYFISTSKAAPPA
ncbi:MAG: radical SAM protein [Dissulfuribacterales bacterium]